MFNSQFPILNSHPKGEAPACVRAVWIANDRKIPELFLRSCVLFKRTALPFEILICSIRISCRRDP